MKVTEGKVVSVHYRGTLKEGTVFDDSRKKGNPLVFRVGSGQILPAFEKAIIGKSPGEKTSISIPSDEAYGPRNDEAQQLVPKTTFPGNFDFHAGKVVEGFNKSGDKMRATIKYVEESSVMLDFNHPLAGEDISFDIEIVECEEYKPQ
jgi:peptidylprolyl isomerase